MSETELATAQRIAREEGERFEQLYRTAEAYGGEAQGITRRLENEEVGVEETGQLMQRRAALEFLCTKAQGTRARMMAEGFPSSRVQQLEVLARELRERLGRIRDAPDRGPDGYVLNHGQQEAQRRQYDEMAEQLRRLTGEEVAELVETA